MLVCARPAGNAVMRAGIPLLGKTAGQPGSLDHNDKKACKNVTADRQFE